MTINNPTRDVLGHIPRGIVVLWQQQEPIHGLLSCLRHTLTWSAISVRRWCRHSGLAEANRQTLWKPSQIMFAPIDVFRSVINHLPTIWYMWFRDFPAGDFPWISHVNLGAGGCPWCPERCQWEPGGALQMWNEGNRVKSPWKYYRFYWPFQMVVKCPMNVEESGVHISITGCESSKLSIDAFDHLQMVSNSF